MNGESQIMDGLCGKIPSINGWSLLKAHLNAALHLQAHASTNDHPTSRGGAGDPGDPGEPGDPDFGGWPGAWWNHGKNRGFEWGKSWENLANLSLELCSWRTGAEENFPLPQLPLPFHCNFPGHWRRSRRWLWNLGTPKVPIPSVHFTAPNENNGGCRSCPPSVGTTKRCLVWTDGMGWNLWVSHHVQHIPWRDPPFSDHSKVTWNKTHQKPQGGAPPVINGFISPLTIDISPINHRNQLS